MSADSPVVDPEPRPALTGTLKVVGVPDSPSGTPAIAEGDGELWSNLMRPFAVFIDHSQEASIILGLSIDGISKLTMMPAQVKWLERNDPDLGARSDAGESARLRAARKWAEFADIQARRGFPLLYAQAVVSLWGELEALVEDFIGVWFLNMPGALKIEQVARVKVPLAEFESLDQDERVRLLVHELEDSLRASLKAGTSRFEVLFDTIGLSGQVPSGIKRDLFEMNQVRNVIVHKASVADRRLAESCPWMGVKPGASLRVGKNDMARYDHAVHEYVLSLINRVRVSLGKKECTGDDDAALLAP